MRFQSYLQEEYLKRINVNGKSYEIFKNSSKGELFKLFKEIPSTGHAGLRGLIDKENNDLYIFSGDCLHWDVAPTINSEADDDNYYELFWTLVLAKEDGYVLWDTLAEIDDEDYAEIEKLLRNRGIPAKFAVNLNEAYLLRHIRKDWEIHKNPSYRDMMKLGKQYEKKDLHKSLRLVIDLSTDDYYAAPIGYLHDDMIDDIGLNHFVYRAIVRLENGGIWFKHLYNEDGIEDYGELDEILSMFKERGIKVSLNNDMEIWMGEQ